MEPDQSEVIIWSRDLVLTNHNSPDHLVEGDVARELLILGAGGAVVGELLLDDRLATQRINVTAEWRLWLLELSTGLLIISWCPRKPYSFLGTMKFCKDPL